MDHIQRADDKKPKAYLIQTRLVARGIEKVDADLGKSSTFHGE